jgi:hypothetical protein
MQVAAIRRDLGMTLARDICAKPQPVQIDFAPVRRQTKPSLSKREIAGVATAVVGLASLGASLYYGARASEISDQISNHATNEVWPENIRALEERGQRFESRQSMFAVAGGLAIVTAGVLYFTGRSARLARHSTEDKLVVAPTVSDGGGGISLSRGF